MTPQTISEPRTHNDYTVGWVCALPKELIAAAAMLDETHPDPPRQPNDHNAYTLGRVGGHNVVVACLPMSEIGNSNSATVATRMTSTFPSIRFGLMVGIGGGVPKSVRLGDVVVSAPTDGFGGVVQWDFGKTEQGGNFKRTGALNGPPTGLLAALTILEKEHKMKGSKIPQYLEELKNNWPMLAPKYTRSKFLKDVLFRADCNHVEKPVVCDIGNSNNSFENIEEEDDDQMEDEDEGNHCTNCDQSKIVRRKPRDMCVHYGLIASGNQVIKDAAFRDEINKRLGGKVLCFEMEAAGLMNNFPCIVIRGICDYADSHKNKDWQEHAAAVAAAFAKELLSVVPAQEVEQMPTIKSVLKEISTDVKKVLSRQLDQEQQAILDWLTPIDYAPRQSEHFGSRQPGTCQWLLDSVEYQAWLKTNKQTLFCPGIPGVGKTILTSIVIDDLHTRFQDKSSVGIAYLYCNFRQQDKQKAEGLLASLLKQLSQECPSLPESVKTLYDHHKKKRTRPSFDEILRALRSVATTYSRVFIVIDALDECQETDGSRTKLLTEIFSLRDKSGSNLFATSRPIPEIEKKFASCPLLKICASDKDIQSYIDGHMSILPSFVSDSPKLQEEIKGEIIQAVDGMFLLARLHIDSLSDKTTPREIRSALKELQKGPEALNHAYKKAVERIDCQKPGFQKLAKSVLLWIACARRPLTTSELRHALAVEEGKPKVDQENLSDIRDIIPSCVGLVTIDEGSDIIRLIHFTTQEYLQTHMFWLSPQNDPTILQKNDIAMAIAHKNITTICVTYLSFDSFDTGFCLTDDEFEGRLQRNPLYDYAARNWGHHARAASSEVEKLKMEQLKLEQLEQLILNLLKSEAKISSCSQAMTASRNYSGYSQRVPKQVTRLHLVAYFGLSKVMEILLRGRYDVDTKDSNGRTPLLWAAMNGNETVVKLLLEKGAELETKSKYDGRTPLSWAAMNGHEAVVKLLLEKGAKLETKSKYNGRTPLSWAAINGHETVVKLLLEKGAELETKDELDGWTPLSWAAMNGHEAVVKLLLKKGAELETKGKYGQTPLSWAAEKGHETVVKLLLEKGARHYNNP